jgi:pimeloyl-ACP methyl ester carboxylesterase
VVRFAARRFVAAGFCAFRFDYYGTGDSEGDTTESGLTGWERDIETAVDELRALANARSVALFGLRLGANLAAQVAMRAPDLVSRLAIWDPIVNGEAYLEQLAAKARPGRAPSPAANALVELDGVRVPASFVSELRAINMANVPLPPATIVVNSVAPDRPAVAKALPSQTFAPQDGAALSSHGPAPWADVFETASALPVDIVEQIIGRFL